MIYIPADLLAASKAAEPFSSTYLQAGIGGTYSAIHKAKVLPATVQNSFFLTAAPIHTQWIIFQWNGGIVPGKVGKT